MPRGVYERATEEAVSDHGEQKAREIPTNRGTSLTPAPAPAPAPPASPPEYDPEIARAWERAGALEDALRPFADAGRRLHAAEGGTPAEALRFITPEDLRAAWLMLERGRR